VRRSGKTTAGARLDADATTGQVTVVKQTCDTTGETPNDNMFYKQVQAALTEGNWYYIRRSWGSGSPRRR